MVRSYFCVLKLKENTIIKTKLFIDIDNTIVDTLPILNAENDKSHLYQIKKLEQIPGIFRYSPPLPDAIDSIYTLSQYYNMYILSTVPWQNPSA